MFFLCFQHSSIVKTLDLNVWTLLLIFLHDFTLFVIDMHQNRSVSLFSTPFDHFHFHALPALKWWVQLRSCHLENTKVYLYLHKFNTSATKGCLAKRNIISSLPINEIKSNAFQERQCQKCLEFTLTLIILNSINWLQIKFLYLREAIL